MSPRVASWLAWLLAGLAVAMFVTNVLLYSLTRSVQPPPSWGTGGLSVVLIFLLPLSPNVEGHRPVGPLQGFGKGFRVPSGGLVPGAVALLAGGLTGVMVLYSDEESCSPT